MDDAVPHGESDLVDLSGISLERLRSLDDSVFTQALRRVVRELNDPNQVLAPDSPFTKIAPGALESPAAVPEARHDGGG